MGSYSKTPLTPTAVNKYIKDLLENDLNIKKLYVAGEVSNVKYHSNGNIYFNIKDENAQINCIMFKNYKMQMDTKLVEGDKIELAGNIYAYIKMGQYSINVLKIRKLGQGDLYQKYLELKNKLQSQGYFDESKKKEIPKFPQTIGVITSDTGAAIKDVISTIKRRYPIVKVKIIPTLVQGKNAYKNIANNLHIAQKYDFDLLILTRGGGSIEDLWSFNEQEVAQAIYDSNIPIISAVGHETDFTIADFVADKRAPTPTGAAEIATPNKEELLNSLNKSQKALKSNLKSKVDLNKQKLMVIKQNQYFINPLINIQNDFMFLNEKFTNEVKNFENIIKSYKEKIFTLKENGQNNLNLKISNSKSKLEHQKESLDNLNPLSILSKGYAVIKDDEKYIKSIKQITTNNEINVVLKDGSIQAKVINIKEKDNVKK